jgi:uncharacterized protein
MLQVTFPEIATVLSSAGSAVAAAESHGCLCGALCASADYPIEQWLSEVVPAETLADATSAQALQLLFADTVRALRGEEMEFQPLLPDEDRTLEERASAIAQWCQGFLYGFGTVRSRSSPELPADIQEILRDLTEIARAASAGGDTDDDEEAYTEVLEYVRVSVQLIHDELIDTSEQAVRAEQDSTPPHHA